LYYAGAELGFSRHFHAFDGYGFRVIKEAGIKTDSGTNVMGTNNAYTDTPLWVLPESFKKIQSQFKVFDKFPYVMDSLFFQKLENSNPNPFPGEIIAALSQNHQSASMFGGPEYDIKTCIQIDSISSFPITTPGCPLPISGWLLNRMHILYIK